MSLSIEIKKKLDNFTLDIQLASNAKKIGILGASGCGKSMTLKSIAGIVTPDNGKIQIGEKIFFDSGKKINVKPQNRNAGYLFQNYALFPNMTVEKNIAAGLRGKKEEKEKRVREMIEKFRLQGLEKRLPGELSGGQQQRTALARIMAYEPEMILLDEPFSALDIYLKDNLQREMEMMLEDYKGIVILVSHNRDEVYRFCEETVILDQGRVIVSDETKRLFQNPRRREAAKLTGCKNFFRAKRLDSHRIELPEWGIVLHVQREIPSACTWVGYRAHNFRPVWGECLENCIPVKVENIAHLPFEIQYYLSVPGAVGNQKKETIKERKEEAICWFVQRENMEEIEKNGMPDFLQLTEEDMMFLEE